jgi:hypothetical protein
LYHYERIPVLNVLKRVGPKELCDDNDVVGAEPINGFAFIALLNNEPNA